MAGSGQAAFIGQTMNSCCLGRSEHSAVLANIPAVETTKLRFQNKPFIQTGHAGQAKGEGRAVCSYQTPRSHSVGGIRRIVVAVRCADQRLERLVL